MQNRKFELQSKYQPAGGQPSAIEQIVQGINDGKKMQTVLGVTGSGKTFTMANIVQEIQRPTLVVVHNKTLAAQLATEFQEFFPNNAVSYFVSYYDYYQPEAYKPGSDTYIEKDASINEEIDRLRHAATMNLLTRRDTLIVASVSCIYGLGNPKDYMDLMRTVTVGEEFPRDTFLRDLTDLQFRRAKNDFKQGMFEVMGDTVEIILPGMETAYRLEFFGDELDAISEVDPFMGEVKKSGIKSIDIFPAKHNATTEERIENAIAEIEKDLEERFAELVGQGRGIEAARLRQRTEYDIEMLREVGYVNGIENYTRYLSGAKPGEAPGTLLDFFPKDYLMFIDESHMTIPQIGAMYNGNLSRKDTLVEYGFRLPSARDNRPLQFGEFEERINQVVYVSATPGKYEKEHVPDKDITELVVRPTGLVDPVCEVRPTEGQIANLMKEIKVTIDGGERVLITTLTKRSAEELTDFLLDKGIKVKYIHSDIDTVERIEILRDLRLGEIDVIVGINLLREGLDLPEVSLMAILDADKRGFLRSRDALVQTIGRAARNAGGRVIMYGDEITPAMKEALEETERRRTKQIAHNKKHGITPKTIIKEIKDMTMGMTSKNSKKKSAELDIDAVPKSEISGMVMKLQIKMEEAAANMEFEQAMKMRDQISALKKRK